MISDDDLVLWTKADEADLPTLRRLEKAAIAYIQGRTGRYYGATAEIVEPLQWNGWPMPLANDPVDGEVTLESWSSGAWSEVDASSYTLLNGFIFLESTTTSALSRPTRYRATYNAGYEVDADDDNVWAAPDDIQQAVLLLVGSWMENREAVGQVTQAVELGVDALLASHTRASV
jgi:hypothetical protein